MKITPMACLARTVIGMISVDQSKQVMVITLPGKPKAIRENLQILTEKGILKHALAQCSDTDRH